MKVLVTGGAGFIGSHLVDALIQAGHDVCVFDSLEPQVHGATGAPPAYLNADARFVRGDVRDRDALAAVVGEADVVFHEAAAVGVGQSMYEIARYMDVNTGGTATLLDILANDKHHVRKLLVASSMSVYGEGGYECGNCGTVAPELRREEDLSTADWNPRCPQCLGPLKAIPTSESKPALPTSPYALSKLDQERLCLMIGRAYEIPTVALRYFNVYGPRQALSNPYTGVAAIFASRMVNANPPVVYEDGEQTRDFVHVSDIVRANLRAMESPAGDFGIFNVGTGRPSSLLDLMGHLSRALGVDTEPEVTHQFRAGDIRHCYSDPSLFETTYGFRPAVELAEGIKDVAAAALQASPEDRFEAASRELAQRRLTR